MEGEGSMEHILGSVMVCTIDDEDRFKKIIDAWIADGEVESFPAYAGDTDKKKKQRKRKVSDCLRGP